MRVVNLSEVKLIKIQSSNHYDYSHGFMNYGVGRDDHERWLIFEVHHLHFLWWQGPLLRRNCQENVVASEEGNSSKRETIEHVT